MFFESLYAATCQIPELQGLVIGRREDAAAVWTEAADSHRLIMSSEYDCAVIL